MRLAFPGLLDALAEGATVVTPTPLLASVAREQFNRAQLARGLESWERPDIIHIDTWMSNCWQEARFVSPNAPSLLSLSQERELWRHIIEHNRPDLFDVRAMAAIAQRANRIMAEYFIPADGEGWSEHADAASFRRWRQAFAQRLKAENWICRADLWRLIPGWMSSGLLKPGQVIFAALTSVSPGTMRLQQRVSGITPSFQATVAEARFFESLPHEMEHVARSVRHLLETEKARSIGILVADLKSHAADLTRILKEVLYPASEPADAVHVQFNPLHAHPLISNGRLLLELSKERISHSAAGAILRSPFIESAAKEGSVRAMASNRLRRARELDFSLADIEQACSGCPALKKAFKRLSAVKAKMRTLMRLPDWSETFSDILEAAKWPAIDAISEAEQRAVDRWKRALSELASLGLVSDPVTLTQALTHLDAILSRPYEHGDWSSPVQIIDADSAEGIEFDHVFVVNASEDAWPSPLSLSPLIPYNFQRAGQVPGSHPQSAIEERARKTGALFTSAPHVQVSFTGNIAPLLRPYVAVSSEPPQQWPGLTAAQAYSPVDLDAQEDNQATPLIQTDDVRGGSSIIKSQSLCPFKAFAEYRLNARGEDDACFGYDALERGNFVHKALENVWKTLKTQAALKSLDNDQLCRLVQTCIEEAVKDDGTGPIRTLTSAAERERLRNVILDWLEIEKARTAPFTVEYLEEQREAEFSGVKLRLRVDRIDRINNGSLVLIDYKSGKQTKNKLEGDRPKEPQLLVYAAAANDPVAGLYFAELKNRDARAVGHGNGKHFYKEAITDHKTGWNDFLNSAKTTVFSLADEFKQGEAAVSPQHGACDYCKIKPICRINSAGASGEEDDEE